MAATVLRENGSTKEGNDDEGGSRHNDVAGWTRRRAQRRARTGLGDGGERLHYWVFGGSWSYDEDPTTEVTGADKKFLDDGIARGGAIVGGRNISYRVVR